MPVLHINHRAGLTKAQKSAVSKKLTKVFVDVLHKDPDHVEIFWHDIEDHNFARGGILLADAPKKKKR